MNKPISDEMLNAYLDNELAPAERNLLTRQIGGDAELRGRTCDLWQMQQLLRGAYPLPRRKSAPAVRPAAGMTRWSHALAASLLLVAGAYSGWLMREQADAEGVPMRQIEAIRADGGRVVLHLTSDDPKRMEAALRMAEQLANTKDREGQPLRVEFVANGTGLHLLRANGSSFATRMASLHQGHPNLRLVACHETMDRMRERGLDVVLLPMVDIAPTAENELAERLTQGWRYVQA